MNHREPTRPRAKCSDGQPINGQLIAARDDTPTEATVLDAERVTPLGARSLNQHLATIAGSGSGWRRPVNAAGLTQNGSHPKRRNAKTEAA